MMALSESKCSKIQGRHRRIVFRIFPKMHQNNYQYISIILTVEQCFFSVIRVFFSLDIVFERYLEFFYPEKQKQFIMLLDLGNDNISSCQGETLSLSNCRSCQSVLV